MKSDLIRKTLFSLVLFPMLLALTACNGNSQTAVPTVTTTTATTTYTLSGSTCYITGTSTVVSSTYCGVTATTGTTTTGTICIGHYYQPGYGWGVCNGSNCHGVYLYDQSGQIVYCQ